MFQYIPSLPPPLFFFRPLLVKQRLDSFFKVAVHLQYQDFLRMERKKERKKGTKKIRAPNNVTDLKYPTVLINTQLVLVFTKFFPVSFDYYTTSRGDIHARTIISTNFLSPRKRRISTRGGEKLLSVYRRGLKGGRDVDVRWNNDFCE